MGTRLLGCLLHAQAYYRMGFRCIRSDNKNYVALANASNIIAHGPGTQHRDQTGHRRTVSVSGTMVNIVGADLKAEEFLKGIILLCRAAG